MEPIKSRNPDGSQNREYYERYYLKNKERKSQLDKERYYRVRSNPDLLILYRKKATEATRRYRRKHPERVIEIRKRQYNARKLRALRLIGDAKCKRCGCDELDYLEFNHKDGNGCQEWRKNTMSLVDRILSKKRDINDLEILCRVCNALEFLERKNNNHRGRFTIVWK